MIPKGINRAHGRLLRVALISSTTLACGISLPASAQFVTTQPIPPSATDIDDNNVDLIGGQVFSDSVDVGIGPSGGGLHFSRKQRPFGDDNSFSTGMQYASTITIFIGGVSDKFSSPNGYSINGTGAKLVDLGNTPNGDNYDYITKDGTVYHFDTAYKMSVFYVASRRVSTITYPDGRVLTLQYDVDAEHPILGGPLPVSRVSSVTSSDGYRLTFGYLYSGFMQNSSDVAKWSSLTSVTASNVGVESCSVSSCSSSWPTVSYAWSASNTLMTKTDPLAKTSSVTYNSSGQITGLRPATSATDTVTYTYDASGKVATATRNGQTWNYAYSDVGSLRTTTVTDPLSNQQ
jgi:YD repeat-containing protein